MAWQRPLAALTGRGIPARALRPRRPRGRPPIHVSASLNLVLPAQLFSEFPGDGVLPGEKRLMLAVLEDAIATVVKHRSAIDPRARRLLAETAGWLASSDIESPFSFVNVCETLGLDPSYLRRGIARLAASE